MPLNLCNTIKQFHVTGLFLYPLKTPENQRFSNISRRYRKRTVARNELTTNNDQNSNQFITFFHLIQIQSIRKEKTNLSKLTQCHQNNFLMPCFARGSSKSTFYTCSKSTFERVDRTSYEKVILVPFLLHLSRYWSKEQRVRKAAL